MNFSLFPYLRFSKSPVTMPSSLYHPISVLPCYIVSLLPVSPSPISLSPHHHFLTGVARVAIRVCPSSFVTVHAPLHINSIDHFYRCITYAGKAVTSGAIDLALDVNPVRKDYKGREFIHPPPGDLLIFLHVAEDFCRLGPLTDRIARMADSTEFDVWNPCNAILGDISVAKVAVQLGDFQMVNVIEPDRLIDRLTS